MLIQRSSCSLKIPPQEVLAFRKFYRKEVLAVLTSNRKEVLAACKIQAQATRKKPQEVAGLRTQKEVLARALILDCTVKCSCEELDNSIVDAGVTIDASWCSCGWSATDAVIAAISVDTGKVSSSCTKCKKMQKKRDCGYRESEFFLHQVQENAEEEKQQGDDKTGISHLVYQTRPRLLYQP